MKWCAASGRMCRYMEHGRRERRARRFGGAPARAGFAGPGHREASAGERQADRRFGPHHPGPGPHHPRTWTAPPATWTAPPATWTAPPATWTAPPATETAGSDAAKTSRNNSMRPAAPANGRLHPLPRTGRKGQVSGPADGPGRSTAGKVPDVARRRSTRPTGRRRRRRVPTAAAPSK